MTSNNRRSFLLASLAAAAAPAIHAQDYPRQRIRIIVGFPPGGGLDASARIIATYLSNVLGQSVIVENRPGASGALAAGFVKNASPDGYELLLAETAPMEISPFVTKKLGYDPIADFTHVGMYASSQGACLVANAAKRPTIATLPDLIREAKANPGKLSYGSSGAGSLQHLTFAYFCHGLGLDVLHVPFRGGGASVPAVLSGDVNLAVSSFLAIQPHVESKKLVLLATAGARRGRATPDTPTFGEFYKEYEPCASEFGLMGPANMRPDVLNTLSKALQTVMQNSEVVAKIAGLQYETTWLAPAAYRSHMQANLRKYEAIVRAANVQPE